MARHPNQNTDYISTAHHVAAFSHQRYIVEKYVNGAFRKMSGHSDLDACIRSAEAFGGNRRVVRSRDGVVVWQEQQEREFTAEELGIADMAGMESA